MANYNNKTASLKTVTHDSTVINTKELFVKGKSIEQHVGKTASLSGTYAKFRSGVTANGITGKIENGSLRLTTPLEFGAKDISVYINGTRILCPITGNSINLWEPTDDITKIYGGITNNTQFGVIINFAVVS